MLGSSRGQGAGGALEEQESDDQVPAYLGGGGRSQKSSVHQSLHAFQLGSETKSDKNIQLLTAVQ